MFTIWLGADPKHCKYWAVREILRTNDQNLLSALQKSQFKLDLEDLDIQRKRARIPRFVGIDVRDYVAEPSSLVGQWWRAITRKLRRWSITLQRIQLERSARRNRWSILHNIFIEKLYYMFRKLKEPILTDRNAQAALYWAIQNNEVAVICILLSHPLIHPGRDRSRALDMAISRGQHAIVRLLLRDGRVCACDLNRDALNRISSSNILPMLRLSILDDHESVKTNTFRTILAIHKEELAMDAVTSGIVTVPFALHMAIERKAGLFIYLLMPYIEEHSELLPKERRIHIEALMSNHGPDLALYAKQAVEHEDLDLVQLFTFLGQFRALDDLFYYACELGSENVISILLKEARINTIDKHNRCLVMAASRGYAGLVEILLESQADPRDNDSISLRVASQYGFHRVVRLLLEDGRADPQALESECLFLAAQEGRISAVQLLLTDGRTDPTAQNSRCLRLAAKHGHAAVVRLLLEDGRADPTHVESLPLRLASQFGFGDVVSLLLIDGRSDPGAKHSGCLRRAIENGHEKIVRMLLKHGRADGTDAVVNDCFRLACDRGNVPVVQEFLNDKRFGSSKMHSICLQIAATQGRLGLVRFLITQYQFDPSDTENALYYAAQKGHQSIVQVLLLDPRTDLLGALLPAASNGQTETMKILLTESKRRNLDPCLPFTDMIDTAKDPPQILLAGLDAIHEAKFWVCFRLVDEVVKVSVLDTNGELDSREYQLDPPYTNAWSLLDGNEQIQYSKCSQCHWILNVSRDGQILYLLLTKSRIEFGEQPMDVSCICSQ